MAVASIQELIAQRELIDERKKRLYDFETSIGTIVVKPPSAALMAEADKMRDNYEGNVFLVYSCIIEPDLRNAELQKAYKVVSPMDIVTALFKHGEVVRITDKLMEIAGFRDNITSKIHEEIKN